MSGKSLLDCLNDYERTVEEIKRITVDFEAQIDEKKKLFSQLNKLIEDIEMPNISKHCVKRATPFELNSYCKTLRKHYERCLEMNKTGYRAANDNLPVLTDLCQYAGKYALRTMDPGHLLSSQLVDLNQFQSANLLPLKEIYRFMRVVGIDTKFFYDAYVLMASAYYKKRIKQHCAMTLERLQFGDPEIIGSLAPVKRRSLSVEGVVKQIISVRRSITDTPFADIKGSEAPMLLLNILKLYDQCFLQEKTFVESFFGNDSAALLENVFRSSTEKIIKSLNSSLGKCRDYRILACCLNQIKLASDELHDDLLLDQVVEVMIRFMDGAVELQAQSILNFPFTSLMLDPLADRLNQAIVEYSSLGILFDRLVDSYEQRVLKEQLEHSSEVEQSAFMINCYNHLMTVLPSLSSKLSGHLDSFAALLCSVINMESTSESSTFEELNSRTALFNEKLSQVLFTSVDILKNIILTEDMRFKISALLCHRLECIYEKLCHDRQLYVDPLQLDTLVPLNILKDQLATFKSFFPSPSST